MELFLPHILDGEDKTSPFKNRIRKNFQHVSKWAKRTQTNCFRIYDRDIKEYPVVIDFYANRFCVQYFAYDINCHKLQEETFKVLSELFNTNQNMIYERTRIKRKKMQQYEKMGDQKQFFIVYEHGVKFLINLVDYLDTGLFLDHRQTRQLIASQAKGKRLLNLFAYTCSFSVHAALAGASYTKSVDLSNTYITWGKENFTLNSLSLTKNEIVRADCLSFLDQEICATDSSYDLIVIDPPTLSRSKKMKEMFDIQKDYLILLQKALRLLAPGGTIFFSTNSRHFIFDYSFFLKQVINEITNKTIPLDFHNKKIHRCWQIHTI